MKVFTCVCTVFVVAFCAQAEALEWDMLTAIFSRSPPIGFRNLPKTPARGWVRPVEDTDPEVTTLCPEGDYSVCLLYKKDFVIGYSIGVPGTWLEDTYNPGPLSFVHDIVRNNVSLKAVKILITPPGEDPITSVVGTGMWILQTDGTYFEVALEDKDLNPDFTKQSCVPGMGLHYYHKMGPTLDCNKFEPIFLLYKNNELAGFGFQMLGTPVNTAVGWFEPIPPYIIDVIFPNPPPCLKEIAESKGIISIHFYFVSEPWNIGCP